MSVNPTRTAAAVAPPETAPPKRDGVRLVLALFAVWVIWGSTYLAMRIAVHGLPAFLMAGTRFVLAGSSLLAIVRLRGERMPSKREWLMAIPIGGLLFLVGNGLVVVAEQTLPSSVAAVVCATTPLVASALAAFGGERPTRIEVFGMLLGIVGVGLLGVGSPLSGAGTRGLLVLLAPVGWAVGSLIARRQKTSGIAPAGAQMIAGGVWMLGMALVLGERVPTHVDRASGLAWLYLVFVGSLVGFTAYSWLLRNARPAVAMSYAYVNPVIAVLLGAALGGEALGWATASATAFIATGIIAVAVLGRKRRA